MDVPEDILELITSYLSGELNEEGIRRLVNWLNESADNKKLFLEYKKAWELQASIMEPAVKPEEEWENFRRKNLSAFMKNEVKEKRANSRFSQSYWRIAASLALIFISALAAIYLFRNQEVEILQTQAIKEIFTLPDGSIITLAPNSKAIYDGSYGKKERKIMVTGWAYIKVEKNENLPFRALAGNLEILVSGTSFYIQSSATSQDALVVLESGKVKAYRKGNPSDAIELKPGQAASYISSKDIFTITHPEPNYAAWNTLRFYFNNTSLEEVVTLIERAYSIKVKLSSPDIGSCRLTATFDNQSPEAILQVIASALHLKLEGGNTEFVLKGMPCQSNK